MPDGPWQDPFNLDTMSGIYPGERPAVYQRLLAAPVDMPHAQARRFRLDWEQQPPGPLFHSDGPPDDNVATLPAFRLAVDDARDACSALAAELDQRGWSLHACGTCAWWRAQPSTTADGLSVGHCAYQPIADPPPATAQLAAQSSLAPACSHWRAAGDLAPFASDRRLNLADSASQAPDDAAERSTPSLWQRLRARLLPQSPTARPEPAPTLPLRKVTAVGTEPCFACQGRIAGLGALNAHTAHNDKETFTVWRCHVCYTTYLGDWIDRWVRLDSLETEETLVRIAPATAAALLDEFQSARAGTGEQRAGAFAALDARLRTIMQNTVPLSHQVKQGR